MPQMGAVADPGSTPGASKSVRILGPNVVGGGPPLVPDRQGDPGRLGADRAYTRERRLTTYIARHCSGASSSAPPRLSLGDWEGVARLPNFRLPTPGDSMPRAAQ